MRMVRRTNSASGAWLLQRAAQLAKRVRTKFGTLHEVIDGFIVRGVRSNERRRAEVIDPPGDIALFRRSKAGGLPLDRLTCGSRDLFNPKIAAPDTIPLGEPRNPEYQVTAFGPALEGGGAPSAVESYGGATAGQRATYFADMVVDGRGEVNSWLRVIAAPVGNTRESRSFTVHSSVIELMAPGFKAVPGQSSESLVPLQLATPVVCEVNNLTCAVTTVFKTVEASSPGREHKIIQAALLLIRFDYVEQVIGWSLLPISAFPAGYAPGVVETIDISANRYTRPARSKVYATDVTADALGNITASVHYQVEVQNYPIAAPADTYHSWLGCSGKALWPVDRSPTIELFDIDVLALNDTAVLDDYGLDPAVMTWFHAPNLVGGQVSCGRSVFARSDGTTALSAPYSVETLDGVQYADQSDGFGSGFYSTPNDPGGYIVAEATHNSAQVSAVTRCFRRFNPTVAEETGCGLLFTDGVRVRYEPLSVFQAGKVQPYLWVSCPQQEVRDEQDRLVTPCVLLACFTESGVQRIAVRKGPIWPEDEAEEDSFVYWKVYPAPTTAFPRAAFYLGNKLMTRPHGALFSGEPA